MNNRNFHNLYSQIISLENLFASWREFKKGKENKAKDVKIFWLDLERNLFQLHDELKNKTYRHSHYNSFYVCDPKRRHIHKAEVRDRVLHHAIMRVIEPIFEKSFVYDSYSSRENKGIHKAILRFRRFASALSQHKTKTVWILKCDIKKFFDNVDHRILLDLLEKKIKDKDILWLIKEVISSFSSEKGIPLGNVTSQLFSNIYLNRLDNFIKREIREKHYIRYADDFVVLCRDKNYLENLIPVFNKFLKEKLNLGMHPRKIIIQKWNQGIDFLGYISFPRYIILRTKTKRRLLKKINNKNRSSYLGLLKHCRGHKIEKALF